MNMNIRPFGDIVLMKTSDARHFGVEPTQKKPGDFMEAFTKALGGALENVNDYQTNADRLAIQMIQKPNSVDVHDVMIAAEQAQESLSLTKQILTKTIDAYNTLTNLR